MPSPTWCNSPAPPIAMAIAAATAEAWDGPPDGASNRFLEAFRKMVGQEAFEEYEMRALDLFLLQPKPPEGYQAPPPWAWFQICPKCQMLKATKYTAAQNGRLKLEALRDPDWIDRRFKNGRTCSSIAKELDCTPSLVVDWAAKHGLVPPKTQSIQEFDDDVRALHQDKQAPGIIARQLETTVQQVRKSLKRQELATKKTGHVYFEREWWVERIQRQGMTVRDAAREAGIKPHACTFWLKRFGLQHLTRNRKRPVDYPQLHDPVQLRELLRRHLDNYESVARELGCASSLVSRQARELLGKEKKHENEVPHTDPAWWKDRIEDGKTTHELAAEAGIKEKSAREKLRVLGLLAAGYKNNLQAERGKRVPF